MFNYLVVLFKNRKKKKIINKFVTLERANDFFKKYLENSKSIIFNKEIVSTENFKYELGLVGVGKINDTRIYLKDDFGRNIVVRLDEDNMSLINITSIRVEEEIYDVQENKKIKFESFVKKYLRGTSVKLISGLNNKVIVQEEDIFKLFSLKTENECERFLDCLTDYLFRNKRMDCLVVKDSSKAQRKYLYELLISKGFKKDYLYRKVTAPKKKGKNN